jgi:hypothetical protein
MYGSKGRRQDLGKSEILLAQISVCLRVLAGVHVFEAAENQIPEQILDPCLLEDSGLRDYEIKLDRGFSPEKTFSRSSFLQISLFLGQQLATQRGSAAPAQRPR